MNPCGVIATYMSRQDWKGKKFLLKVRAIFFNLCLFIVQLAFMVAGTAYGKIKIDPKYSTRLTKVLSGIEIVLWSALCLLTTVAPYWIIPVWVIGLLPLVAAYRGGNWALIWRAAQCSHVRLCLKKAFSGEPPVWDYINFGHPKAEMQYWRLDQIDGKRFEYFDPTFPTPPEFMEPVIQYAEDQVGKPYDELQLISTGLHLIAWIVYPWCWGKELKIIKVLNRPGGREHCISGVTACLRWGEKKDKMRHFILWNTTFFFGYSTATTFPCQVPISKNWEPESDIVIQKRYFDRLVEETTGVPDILRGRNDDRTNH